jgi:CheY-like chemotaxis protein
LKTEAVAKGNLRLDRLDMLVVEDSRFMRSVIATTLRTIGVGTVHTAADGAEAVRFLEGRQPGRAPGAPPVDVVLTDLVMPELDGLVLLRWIRSAPRSPDKFLPVFILSGAADRHYVEQARDVGASDFIAKPFSVGILAARLLAGIARPRRFVLTRGYFGPDRRRADRPVQMDCRMTAPQEILTVHGRVAPASIGHYPVVMFDPLNRLGQRLGLVPTEPVPALPPEVLEAAEAEILSRTGDYATWIAGEVDELGRKIVRLSHEPESRPALMADIARVAHEMRGQGGMFGYPLVTLIAKSLYEAAQDSDAAHQRKMRRLLKAHSDAIKAVMNGHIAGDGGTVGKQLLASLDEAKRKYALADGDDA